KFFLEGLSEREITRKVNKPRNTVRKYIKEYRESQSEDVRDLPITEEMIREPAYKKRQGRKRVLTAEIQERIRGFIKDNEWKRKHLMHKQQMKIIDMHDKFLDEGYQISYTTVRNFINREVSKIKEVFIR